MDRSLRGGTSSVTGLEHRICRAIKWHSLVEEWVGYLCSLAVTTEHCDATDLKNRASLKPLSSTSAAEEINCGSGSHTLCGSKG